MRASTSVPESLHNSAASPHTRRPPLDPEDYRAARWARRVSGVVGRALKSRQFAMEPCSASFHSDAEFAFESRLSVRASATELFWAVADDAREAEWFPGFQSVAWLTPAPHGVGSERIYELDFLRIHERFTVWREGRELTFELRAMSLPIVRRFQENYLITPRADGGADMRWTVAYEPRPSLRRMQPLMHDAFKADFREAARGLARMLGAIEPAVTRDRV